MDLHVNSVLDDVISGGREFHVRDAAARKARSPMVRRRVEGTTTADVDDERRRRYLDVGHQPNRPEQVHVNTGKPTPPACTLCAREREASINGAVGTSSGTAPVGLKEQNYEIGYFVLDGCS